MQELVGWGDDRALKRLFHEVSDSTEDWRECHYSQHKRGMFARRVPGAPPLY